MDGKFFYDRKNTTDDLKTTENSANFPVEDAEPLIDNSQTDADLNPGSSMDYTRIPDEPMDEPLAEENSNVDPRAWKTQVEGTTLESEISAETLPYRTPADQVLPDERALTGSIYDNPPTTVGSSTPEVPLVSTSLGNAVTLLNLEDSDYFRKRWSEIQGKFVDEPRAAVQEADALVSEVVDKITQIFTSERGTLESQWKQGNDVSTEDLRKALQHYRSFFKRLVV